MFGTVDEDLLLSLLCVSLSVSVISGWIFIKLFSSLTNPSRLFLQSEDSRLDSLTLCTLLGKVGGCGMKEESGKSIVNFSFLVELLGTCPHKANRQADYKDSFAVPTFFFFFLHFLFFSSGWESELLQ